MTDIQKVDAHEDLRVLVDKFLCSHMHISSNLSKASCLVATLVKSPICRSRNFILTLYIELVRSLLRHCSCLCNTEYFGDIRILESPKILDSID